MICFSSPLHTILHIVPSQFKCMMLRTIFAGLTKVLNRVPLEKCVTPNVCFADYNQLKESLYNDTIIQLIQFSGYRGVTSNTRRKNVEKRRG